MLDRLFGKDKEEVKPTPTWEIDKSFSFCYGHRVWSQELKEEYCATGDAHCACRHLHGHEGLLHVFLEGGELERGMVTDFKHLGWLKNFLDGVIDHKFILDLNDPWFVNIINAEPIYDVDGDKELLGVLARQPLNTTEDQVLSVVPMRVPGTEHLAGWTLDVEHLSGPEREFFEGFFLVNFLPTSENLCKWIFDCINEKMSKINVRVSRVTWNETPKSRASYINPE